MANNPTLMSMPICRDAEKNTIPATDNGTTGKFSEQYGWQGINSLPLSAGGKAVERLDFNGVLALLGGIDYMTQRGYTFEWDSNLPYVVGCIVIDTLDGKTYRCVNDVPAGGSAPSLDTTKWIPYDIADYVGGALRLTNYSVGDTSNLAGIPAGYFLECTTGGTTGATSPTVTQPVSAGQTISDGTVTWTVRKCENTNHADSTFAKKLDAVFSGTMTNDGNDVAGSAIVSSSFGANSWYIKNAKGFIIQGGKVATSNMSAHTNARDTTVGLPISFSNTTTPLWCFTNPNRNGYETPNVNTWCYCSPTNIYIGTNNTVDIFNITWVAMGW